MQNTCNWIVPEWPAPSNVKALTTVRTGGVSQSPFDSFNLALHVNDEITAVLQNREYLKKAALLPEDPLWLNQVHGTEVLEHGSFSHPYPILNADASIAEELGQVCAVLTADCLPILICNKSGTKVSAIHAGWRGLSNGILEIALQKLKSDPKELMVWFGPAIGPLAFEVKEDVLEAFKDISMKAFKPSGKESWYANLYQIAREKLLKQGITDMYGGQFCTFSEPERFFSYRRSNSTGRMATLIWLA